MTNINPNIFNIGSLPAKLPITQGQPSVQGTFQSFLSNINKSVNQPYKIAEDMMSGKKPFKASELIVSLANAERKINLSIRIINDITRSIKQLEAIQA